MNVIEGIISMAHEYVSCNHGVDDKSACTSPCPSLSSSSFIVSHWDNPIIKSIDQYDRIKDGKECDSSNHDDVDIILCFDGIMYTSTTYSIIFSIHEIHVFNEEEE